MDKPDVNDLFPANVDELFPQAVENDRYRRQTLGTSPVQDLIFGDTSINPVARVLDHFGQGFKQSWGADDPNRISRETEDYLKVNKQFDAWNEGQNSIVKAANESLFRPAAVQLVKEVHDAAALGRAASGLFTGTQAAVAQIGEEVGQPQAGREIAAIPEAVMGSPHPTGIPPAPWKYPLDVHDLPKASELKVVGAGEEGYFGTAPSEVAPPISEPQTPAKPAGMPVDLFAEPRDTSVGAAPVKAEPEPALPAPEAEAKPVSPIAADVTKQLISAGRPEAEAQASGELIASHYQARAERFKGERGTPEQLYVTEGPEIRSGEGKAPIRSEPIKSEPSGSAGTPEATKADETVTGFTTAKGSTYTVHEDGTTTRDKAARSDVGHEGDSGIKPQTARTIYVDADRASALSGAGISGANEKGFRVIVKDGKASLLSWNEKADKWGISPLSRDIPFTEKPEVGKAPVELWKPASDVPGHEAYRGQHAGNAITEIRTAAPQPITTVPELKKALRGRAAADPQTWSLYEFLAKEGGLKPTPDLHSIFGNTRGPFVPGFGPLLRPSGLTMEEALTRAKENSYIFDPNDLAHVGHDATRPAAGELTKTINDLQDMIAEESRGRKNYRTDHVQPEAKINPEEERGSILDELHKQVEAAGGKVIPGLEDRVVEIVQKEGVGDVHDAYERAIMESHDANEADLNARRATKETAEIRGHDAPDSGAAPDTLKEFVDDSGYTWASEQEASRAASAAPSEHGAHDRASGQELEYFQTKIGEKIPYAELKAAGFDTETKLYHQTSKENAASIRNGGFDISDARARARLSDEGVPNGVFLKPHNKDIGVGAAENPEQMPVFIRRGNQKVFSDRGTLSAFLDNDKKYAQLADEAKVWDREQAVIFKKQFEDGPRRGRGMFNEEHEGQADAFLKAWEAGNAERATAARARATEVLKDAGIDTVVIKHDAGSLGRSTETVIAVGGNQIADAIPATWGEAAGNVLFQIKRGKINLRKDAKPIITLFKDANASTFIHETGHHWLEELMKDAEHPLAPAELKTDAIKVLDWLGVPDADAIKTSHHEKFARGFERYMMEGKAPNQALAGVFAKFKNWLTKIYQTVTRLKSPINDEIRGVFDRLLTMKPSDVKIEPENPAKNFADIHEADALNTPPEMAHPAAETIQGERDNVAVRHVPEEQDARLKNTPDQARRSEAGNPQPASDTNAAGTLPGEAGSPQTSGTIGAGGIEAAPEGVPAPKVARTEPPVSPHDKFPDKVGNIRLDNLNTPEDLNQIIRQTAEENGDFQNVRGPVSDAQVLDLAEAAGVDAAFIDSRKLGEAWTAPQIVALRRLLIQSAQSVHDLARKAAEGAEADVMAYAEAKARHQLIQERVSSVTAEAGRALRAFQSKFTEGSGDVNAYLKDATGKTLFQLQQEAKFLSKLQTPQQTSKFISDTSKGTFRNAILEYYINALISGPVTHSRYVVSNAVNALWTPLVEIPFASVSGKIREVVKGEPIQRVHLGEAGAQLYGMIKGSRDGLSAAIEAFKSGVSPALPTEKMSPHFAEASQAIPGVVGQVLRIPSRSVAGIHSFFKSLRYEQNVQALAYREAANEGLKGDAFSNRVAELTTNPTEAMMENARTNALKELYMSPTEYHSKIGGLVRFTNNFLPAKIVVPFMKIGSQITRNAFLERTPLGLLDKKVRSNLSGSGAEFDFQAAKIAGGMALMATSVGLMAEGMMTGDGPEEPAKRAVWLLTHTPASIKIGDITFKYGNTGPLGMLMRFVANTYEAGEGLSEKDLGTLAVNFFEGFAKSVLDETFLRGVKDMLDAMFHPKEYGGRYIKNQITNWIPWSVGLSQVARKIDPFQRETKGIWQAAQAKIPYLSEQLMPRRDMFGEPIPNGGPLPDYANDPVIKAMDELHIGVGKIGKKIRGIDLTEQQYDDLARVAGRMAKTRLNAMVNIISNPQVPQAQRIEMIHSTISSSREAARSLIMMQNPDIIKKATDAKIEKLRVH